MAVPAGYITDDARPAFFAHMDAANVDLKGFTEAFYRDVCAAELGPVLDTLRYLKRETSVWLELTTLLIPGLNDDMELLEEEAAWLASVDPDIPLHLPRFFPQYRYIDCPATPLAT